MTQRERENTEEKVYPKKSVLWWTKGSDLKLHLRRLGDATAGGNTGGKPDAAWSSVSGISLKCAWDPLASALLPWVKGTSAGRWESTHLKWTEENPNPSGILLQKLRIQPHIWVVMASEQRESPDSSLAPACVFQPATKVRAARAPWEKMWLVTVSNPALPTKALDSHRLHTDV